MNDWDIFNFFNNLGGKQLPTKEEVTKRYIQGYITKQEYIKRMKEIEDYEMGNC